MCNCNQKRAIYSSENNKSPKGMVRVILKENTPMVLNGDITGRMYVFRKVNDVNWVDRRDLMSIKEINGMELYY